LLKGGRTLLKGPLKKRKKIRHEDLRFPRGVVYEKRGEKFVVGKEKLGRLLGKNIKIGCPLKGEMFRRRKTLRPGRDRQWRKILFGQGETGRGGAGVYIRRRLLAGRGGP